MPEISKKLEQYLRKARILTKFKANLQDEMRKVPKKERPKRVSFIATSFSWRSTPEGKSFWGKHDKAFDATLT